MSKTKTVLYSLLLGIVIYFIGGLVLAAIIVEISVTSHAQVGIALAYYILPPAAGIIGMILGILLSILPQSPNFARIRQTLLVSAVSLVGLLLAAWAIARQLAE